MESTSNFRAETIRHDILASCYEYLDRGGLLIVGQPDVCINWDGFAWSTASQEATPFEAYLVVNQPQAEEIDGVDNNSLWAWVEEATLADQFGTSLDFVAGMMFAFKSPHSSVSSLLQDYNDACYRSSLDYEGEDEVPSHCENETDFDLGVDMGQQIYYELESKKLLCKN